MLDELALVSNSYMPVMSETSNNPHEKIIMSPQCRSIVSVCVRVCVKFNVINCLNVHYIVQR